VGADAYPDFIVGQLTAHPGSKDGWQADTWVRWVMDKALATGAPCNIAFALGYATHAAGDIFGHTYVNLYSGDVFDLSDSDEPALRHVAVESFLARHIPPLVDATGQPVGALHQSFSAPKDFVRDVLILGEGPSGEYFGRPLALHLYTMRKLHSELRKLEQVLSPATPGLTSFIANLEREAFTLKQKLDDYAGPIADAQRALTAAEQALSLEQQKIAAQQALIDDAVRLEAEARRAMKEASDELAKVPKEISNVQNRISDLTRDVRRMGPRTMKKVCATRLKWVAAFFVGAWVPTTYCHVSDEVNHVWVQLTNAIADAERVQNDLIARSAALAIKLEAAKLDASNAAVTKAAATAAKADLELKALANVTGQKAVVAARDSLGRLLAAQKEIEANAFALRQRIQSLQNVQGDLSNIGSAVRAWRADVEDAALKYVVAAERSIASSMTGADPLGPLAEWWKCSGLVFVAVPAEVPGAICAASHGIGEISRFRAKLRQILGVAAWLADPIGKAEDTLTKVLMPVLYDAATDIGGVILGDNFKQYVTIQRNGAQPDQLQAIFGRDKSRKQLLLIPDVVSRIQADMALQNGVFDGTAFAAVRNSSILGKLTLLSGTELNRLAASLGVVGPTTYGAQLFPVADPSFNILYGAVRSLDGSHQWQERAPKYPRRSGSDSSERRYGYRREGKKGGFRPFEDEKARRLMFNRLFTGPLNPSLETPGTFGFSEVLPAEYQRWTAEEPFPETGKSLFRRMTGWFR
jgi:hypothetical protein